MISKVGQIMVYVKNQDQAVKYEENYFAVMEK